MGINSSSERVLRNTPIDHPRIVRGGGVLAAPE